MIYSETLFIDLDLLIAIKKNNVNKHDCFLKFLDTNNNHILNLLNGYDYFDGTEGQVYNYLINEESITIDVNGNGSFTVEFTVHNYYGCADLNKEYEREMDLSFQINFINNQMEVTGENWEERAEEEI